MSAKPPQSPKPVPVPTPATKPFWEGTQAGELRVQHCQSCKTHYLYPRTHCPQCGSDKVEWVRASGRARLYSYVINHMAAPGWQGETPYVIAVVQLEEGPRMMSNLVGIAADPAALVLDMPLEVTFEARGDQKLPLFKSAANAKGAA